MSPDPRGPHRPITSLDSCGPTLAASGLPSSRGLLVLCLSVGIVWALNLIFIVDPANQFFSSFEATANGFASQSIGGAALPDLVASHPAVFAPLIAAVTAYLAVAFLLGILLGRREEVLLVWILLRDRGHHDHLALRVQRYLGVVSFLLTEGTLIAGVHQWVPRFPTGDPSHRGGKMSRVERGGGQSFSKSW